MRPLNNTATLQRYSGQIWFTKPECAINKGINVCLQMSEGTFVAIDLLRLESGGLYYKKQKRLGKLGDPDLDSYVVKLLGAGSAAKKQPST